MDDIALFFCGERGLAVLRTLARSGHGVDAAYAPDARLADPTIVEGCRALEVPLIGVHDVNADDFVAALAKRSPQLLLIAGFPQIFRAALLKTAKHGAINLHGGRLPQYRGGSPLNWQIINHEARAGVSIIRVDEGIDTGDVLAEGTVPIGADDTIADVHASVNALFPELVLEVIEGLDGGKLSTRVQDEEEAAYWHQRHDEDGRIIWPLMSAQKVHDLVRAVSRPYPGAFTLWDQRRVRIYGTSLPARVLRGVPGRVLFLQGEGPFVVGTDRALLLKEYEVEGEPSRRLPHGLHLR